MKKTVLLFLFVSLSVGFTNKSTAQQKNAPCSSEKYQEFDFWIGSWEVYSPQNKLIGLSTIQKLANACGIQEHWTSKTSTYTGTSYNYYNSTDDSWNQVWIDNLGASLILKGSFKAPQMILEGKSSNGKTTDTYNRITWTKNNDGTVIQLWQTIDKNNKVTQELFRGIYKKITK